MEEAAQPNRQSVSLPNSILELQNKLAAARTAGNLFLQAGDTGFATAPSNIALLKYWGKQPGLVQIPVNSSISYTLGGFRSFTQVVVRGRFFPSQEVHQTAPFANRISLNGSSFANLPAKMDLFVKEMLKSFAWDISLEIRTRNNFPTACGIASSASGYAALVAAIDDLQQLSNHFTFEERTYWNCYWARMGSGSATRSALLEPTSAFVAWDIDTSFGTADNKSSTFSVPVSPNIKRLNHLVLVMDDLPKSITSSDGHMSASTSVLQNIRVAAMPEKYQCMRKALLNGDLKHVANLTEEDAFAMHAVMQTSEHPACYLTGKTAQVIANFVKWRNANSVAAFWTLDAGPNIHLLCHPGAFKQVIFYLKDLCFQFSEVQHILLNNSDTNIQIGRKNYTADCKKSDFIRTYSNLEFRANSKDIVLQSTAMELQ